MQVCHVILALSAALLAPSDAGYYKRPPPSKLHYLPKPHHHHKPPPYYRRPSPIHAPRNPIRPPPRPYIAKPTPPPTPPFPPASWKTQFRAPEVKEQFHSSLAFAPETHHFLQDDDKGPIHTIPAPDLSQAERPASLHYQDQARDQESQHNQASASALDAVLRHAEVVRAKTTPVGYQVTEDPTVYKPHSPSYFAPDPDPSLPTIEVPQTTDPHSVPSNGVTPLDLYQQQVADQEARREYEAQHAAAGNIGSTLSPQDLYQLLHGSQQTMTPQLYQQYLQAAAQQPASAVYQQVFQAGLLYPHHYNQPQVAQFSTQSFQPQFETFNYNEQTQESAHGSDSFPSASISVGVKRAVSKETRVSGEGVGDDETRGGQDYLDKGPEEESDEVGVISNQVDYDESTEENGGETFPPNVKGFYTTLPNKQAADALATLAAAGSINHQLAQGSKVHNGYGVQSVQTQRENEERRVMTEEQRAEEERKQDEQERVNEIRNQEEQMRKQEMITHQQNRQVYSNHALGTGQEIHNLRSQNQIINQNDNMNQNHNMNLNQNMNKNQNINIIHNMDQNHNMNLNQNTNQNHMNQNQNINVIHHMNQNHNMNLNQNMKTIQNMNIRNQNIKEPQGQSTEKEISTESDYSEDEILDTSDKDQRINQMQNSAIRTVVGFDSSYFRQKTEKENESRAEDQSYEDTDSDYSQEEVKEINNTNKMTEKSVNYNAQQNQLPFGAKLRPKRA